MVDKLKRSYASAVLKCLAEYQEPTLSEIRTEMCYRGFCPDGRCTHEGGRKNGESCGHVLTVSILGARVNNMLYE